MKLSVLSHTLLVTCVLITTGIRPIFSADRDNPEEHATPTVPRLNFNAVAATSHFIHVIRMPAEGETIVLFCRSFSDCDRVSVRVDHALPFGNLSTWPDSPPIRLDYSSKNLTVHSLLRNAHRTYSNPPVTGSRPEPISRTSQYQLQDTAYVLRDYYANQAHFETQMSANDSLVTAKSDDAGYRIFAHHDNRPFGADSRRTVFSFNDTQSLVSLATTLSPHTIHLDPGRYSPATVLWHDPPRHVQIRFRRIEGNQSAVVPHRIIVREAWNIRRRTEWRRTIVERVDLADTEEAATTAWERYSNDRDSINLALQWFAATRDVPPHSDSQATAGPDKAERQRLTTGAIERVQQAHEDSPVGNRYVAESQRSMLSVLGGLNDRQVQDAFGDYLQLIHTSLPKGLAIPLGMAELQQLTTGESPLNYSALSQILVQHAAEQVDPDEAISELLLRRQHLLLAGTTLRIVRNLRSSYAGRLSPVQRLDLNYLEASLLPLIVDIRAGQNSNWRCVREELKMLEEDIPAATLDARADELRAESLQISEQLTPDEREQRDRMLREIDQWCRITAEQ